MPYLFYGHNVANVCTFHSHFPSLHSTCLLKNRTESTDSLNKAAVPVIGSLCFAANLPFFVCHTVCHQIYVYSIGMCVIAGIHFALTYTSSSSKLEGTVRAGHPLICQSFRRHSERF